MHAPSAALLEQCGAPARLMQGYFGRDGARIRRRTEDDGGSEATFTWKRRLASGRMMEIETAITDEDFELLWPECTSSLVKDRFLLPCIGAGKWEMDAFLVDGRRLFWMVEVEDTQEKPWRPGDPLHPVLLRVPFRIAPTSSDAFSSLSLSRPGAIEAAASSMGCSRVTEALLA